MMNGSRKSGQAAIEFLVTYGWAIMAAMIVIGALTYFGITNPSTSLPDKCMFSNSLECKDFIITSSLIRLQLLNGFGQTIYNPGVASTDGVGSCAISSVAEWAPEDIIEINCTGLAGMPFTQREKAKVKLTVTYTKTPTGYNQVSLGELYATVQ